MRFRDPKTGEVFEDIEKAHIWFCGSSGKPCEECPLSMGGTAYGCVSYRNAHPAEAARLMGLEVVKESAPGETPEGKSLFCQYIGVSPGQPFLVHGYPYCDYPPMVYGQDGCVRLYAPDGQKGHKVGGRAITWTIDHPERVEPCEGYAPQEAAFKAAAEDAIGGTP